MALMSISRPDDTTRDAQGIRAHAERKRMIWATLTGIAEGCMDSLIRKMGEDIVPLQEIPSTLSNIP